ncbi:MAG: hypothetical protein Kow00108_14480 [Calditrichia bacterium]
MSSILENINPKLMDHETRHELVRAGLSHFFSIAMSSPLEMAGDEPEQLASIIDEAPEYLQSEIQNTADRWKEALAQKEDFKLAYATLFLGPFKIMAPPYASFYLEPDHKLMGQVSDYVANSYAEAGLIPGTGPRELPDHVALEWEFIYFLLHQYFNTGDKKWLQRKEQFIQNHMAHWIPMFADAVRKASVHPFYDSVVTLMEKLM